MSEKSISEIAESFGLSIESFPVPDKDSSYKVFKGVNPIFVGSEEAVSEFLATYDKTRPGLYEASMFGYKE